MTGRLIVFEGVEGCGKTSQLQRCHEWFTCEESREWLQSLYSLGTYNSEPMPPVVVTREPGGTELGLELRRLLLFEVGKKPIQDSAELLLFAADRAQHVEEVLKPQLALGAIVLCDRYTDSTTAYQGYGRGLSLRLIEQLNSIATSGLESDLTLWLDVDVEVGLARTRGRGVADRIEQETRAFYQRVQHGYTELAQAHPERIVRVDASLSEAVVQQQIQNILSQRLTRK